ncbi:YihY/virulence factor BrkB family protein [Aquipuribacter sp. MA13-6]|uniref:YihY/virulence factor BrkB family protein n=1 Tax=unclassified Aquipuribacter TaxID=2635084 RepID=UPI003EE8FA39
MTTDTAGPAPTRTGSTAGPRSTRVRRTRRVLRELGARTSDNRLLGLGAETAFFVVLGVFPALLIAAGLLGVLDVLIGQGLAVEVQQRVVTALRLVLTDDASAAVASVEDLFSGGRSQLLTVAGIGGLVTLSTAFDVLINALNLSYTATESRPWWRRRLLGLALALGTLLMLVLSLTVLVVGPLFGRGEGLADLVGLGSTFTFVWDVVRLPVMVLAVVAWTTVVFHAAPNTRTRWRDALPGASLTAVLWLLGSAGFHLYLVLVADGNPILSAFGGGVIVMLWVYLLCLSLLLGGQLNAVLLSHGRPPPASRRWLRRRAEARRGEAHRG